MKFAYLNIFSHILFLIPGIASFSFAQANNCPEWLNQIIPSDAKMICVQRDSNLPIALIGKGVIDHSKKFGFAFYCKTDDCRSLGILVADFAKEILFEVTTSASAIGVPAVKDPQNFEWMTQLRIRAAFMGLTSKETNQLAEPFSRKSSLREGLSLPTSDKAGWNWSSNPTPISTKKLMRSLQSLLRPAALPIDRFCKVIHQMYALSVEKTLETDTATVWLYEENKSCQRIGF